MIDGEMGLHLVYEMEGIDENIGRSSVLAQYGERLHVTEDRVEEPRRAGYMCDTSTSGMKPEKPRISQRESVM